MSQHEHASPGAAHPSKGPYLWATALIGVPVLALLAVPLYSRTEPVVWDFPMFYWWTCLWIIGLSAGSGVSFRLLERARKAAR